MGWRMRPLAPTADRGWVKELWAAALPPTWPPLPAGIAMLGDGLVAEAGAGPVGLAAVDMRGQHPADPGRTPPTSGGGSARDCWPRRWTSCARPERRR